MPRLARKNPSMVALENRCQICDTKLTLYPKDYLECPHCGQKVCRQCWSTAWPTKTFSSEQCTHLAENDGLSPIAYAQKERNLSWDWPRLAFFALVGLAALGVFYYLLNLFIF